MDKTMRIIMDTGLDYLELPADEYTLANCADKLRNPNGIMFTILAMLPDVSYGRVSKGDLAELNLLAEKLAVMQIAEYVLTANVMMPEDAATDELNFLLCPDDAEGLLPSVNLHGFGETVLKNCNALQTAYRQINRADFQPVQAPEAIPEQDMTQQMM